MEEAKATKTRGIEPLCSENFTTPILVIKFIFVVTSSMHYSALSLALYSLLLEEITERSPYKGNAINVAFKQR